MSVAGMFHVLLVVLFAAILAVDVNEEILDEKCDCRDYYGGCRRVGDRWTDEEIWSYQCEDSKKADAVFNGCTTSGETVGIGENKTIDKLWYSCSADNLRLKFETEPYCLVNGDVKKVGENFQDGRFEWLCLETGRWVTGCYYSNETHPDILLKIGESGYNGLIKHVCDRFIDYPGRVQYYSEVRKDVHVKHPTNKGINKNFPEPADLTLKDMVSRWEHESAALFVATEKTAPRKRIRFLPDSRTSW